MRVVMRLARLDNVRIVVPTVVLGEWWRGRSKVRDTIVASIQVEPLGESLAKMAGEAALGCQAAQGLTCDDEAERASGAATSRRRPRKAQARAVRSRCRP
jgi:hypothetical protein